jgi:hypothetical protein
MTPDEAHRLLCLALTVERYAIPVREYGQVADDHLATVNRPTSLRLVHDAERKRSA